MQEEQYFQQTLKWGFMSHVPNKMKLVTLQLRVSRSHREKWVSCKRESRSRLTTIAPACTLAVFWEYFSVGQSFTMTCVSHYSSSLHVWEDCGNQPIVEAKCWGSWGGRRVPQPWSEEMYRTSVVWMHSFRRRYAFHARVCSSVCPCVCMDVNIVPHTSQILPLQ